MKTRSLTDNGKTKTLPLHFAISNKMTTEVRQLVEGGVNVNQRDHKKRTALMISCLEDDEYWSAGVVRMLLQAGANAALCDVNGRNALMFAVIFQRRNLVDLLLHAVDFNINQRDVNRNTALQYAIARGNKYTINRVLQECKRQGNPCLIEDISNPENILVPDLKRPSSKMRQNSIFYNPVKSQEPWKRIIDEERASSRIHRSSSDLNIHQFRRGVMRRFEIRSARRQRSGSLSSSSLSSPSSDRSSAESLVLLNRANPRLIRPASAPRHFYPSISANKLERTDFSTINGDKSWKSFVPMFWHIFKEQSSPSYRPSATPIPQTYEEALGLPPNDLTSETEDVQEIEQVQRKGSLRRSSSISLTTNPFINSTRSTRLNSSPNADTTAINDTSGGSLTVPAAVQPIPVVDKAPPESKQKEVVLDASISLPDHTNESKVTEIKTEVKVKERMKQIENAADMSPIQQPAKPPRPKSSRPTTGRSRPLSATQSANQLKPVEKQVKIDNSSPLDGRKSTSKLTEGVTISQEKTTAKRQIPTTASSNSMLNKNSRPTSQELHQITNEQPKRASRRPDSFLFRDRVLSDIIEENESPVSPVSSDTPRYIRPTIRCSSAYVRGKTANGRLLR